MINAKTKFRAATWEGRAGVGVLYTWS